MYNLRPQLIRLCLACWLMAVGGGFAQAQLRIVDYNSATAQAGSGTQTARLPYSSTILEAIGLETVGGIAKPIDVLILQEQFSMEVTTQSFVDVLNSLYGVGTYARSTLNGIASSDFISDPGLQGAGGRPGLIYNTQTVQLIGEVRFGSVGSTPAVARQTLRYQLRPVGYDSNADFYVYNDHYRAGDDANANLSRLTEAIGVRANSDALGDGVHAIYAGDYNITSSNADMYQHLTSSGNGQAFDPLNLPGTWHNNQFISGTDIRFAHTQSPAATGEEIPGYSGGGMDDRFDFQLVTGELLDGEGLSILSGSYRTFGNNGTHPLNGSITSGSGASPTVLAALKANSDHLPVVADYQLPAKMNSWLASVPSTVAQGASVALDVFVQNVANVLTASGADELDYIVSVSGNLLGSGSGTAFPLGGSVFSQVFLDTATTGFKSGTVTVTATSQGAANSVFNFPVSYTVGTGNGGPVFGVVAKDTFDENKKLLSFTQDPAPGAYSSVGDGFQTYQVGVSPSIPFQLVDDSTNGNPADTRGIINSATKTDIWFGITDTVNVDNLPAGNPGVGTATWVFDVAGVIDLELSLDMGAMGDFEATADYFDWTYQFDSGPVTPLFTSSVDEAGSLAYTMVDGDVVNLPDPLQMTTSDSQTFTLTNVLQSLTSPLVGTGSTLTLQLTAKTDGGDEAFAFDNLIIEGTVFVSFLEADFNQDGNVNDLDLAQWQGDYGLNGDSDADSDGDSDGSDFLVWQQQFGQSTLPLMAASTAATQVPEPTGLLLALAAWGCLGGRRSERLWLQ